MAEPRTDNQESHEEPAFTEDQEVEILFLWQEERLRARDIAARLHLSPALRREVRALCRQGRTSRMEALRLRRAEERARRAAMFDAVPRPVARRCPTCGARVKAGRCLACAARLHHLLDQWRRHG